ncbi:hypothetical protein GCM10027273_34700 [Nocardioides pakistanensis]
MSAAVGGSPKHWVDNGSQVFASVLPQSRYSRALGSAQTWAAAQSVSVLPEVPVPGDEQAMTHSYATNTPLDAVTAA